MRFEWVPPDWQSQSIAAAVTAAQHANKVVIFAYDDGTEGADRGGNDQNARPRSFPGWQDALISAVAAVEPEHRSSCSTPATPSTCRGSRA